MLLVLVNGLGLCHARVECDASAANVTDTACESGEEHQEDVSSPTSNSCGGHGMPEGKLLVSPTISLHLPAVVSAALACHRAGPPPCYAGDLSQRFASRSLPLLI